MKTVALLILSVALVGACGDDDKKSNDASATADADVVDAAVDSAPGGSKDGPSSAPDTAVAADTAKDSVSPADTAGGPAAKDGGGSGDAVASDARGPTDAVPADTAPADTAPADTGAGDAPAGQNGSMAFVASMGGKLTLGGATLGVPAGALAADTTITLTISAPTTEQAARGDILGSIYTFGPDGTKFSAPADLTLPVVGTVPADKDAVVAWLDASTGLWVRTPSVVTGSAVVGKITHFTAFAVLLVGKGGMCPAAPACGGGVPQGTWEISAACLTQGPAMDAGNCGTAGTYKTYNTLAISGSVTITGDKYTATETLVSTQYLTFSAECIAAINAAKMTYSACTDVQTALNKSDKPNPPVWTCAGTVADGCNCVTTNSMPINTTGSVTASGSQITFMSDTAKTPAQPSDYCVKGNVLTVSAAEGVYTAVKK